MTSSPRRRAAICSSLLAASMLLGGCAGRDPGPFDEAGEGDHGHDEADGHDHAAPFTSVDTTAATGGVPTPPPTVRVQVDHPPATGAFAGAREDVEMAGCAGTDGGAWVAEGSVTNPAAAVADYRIYVSFLDRTGETLALVETSVPAVGPDETSSWQASTPVVAAGLRCVLRVERHTS